MRRSPAIQQLPRGGIALPEGELTERGSGGQPLAHQAVGKVLFASLFAVVLPAVLVAWTALLDRRIAWPVPQWPVPGGLLVLGGGMMMGVAMLQLRVQGHGPPMSAYPPTELVTTGVYALVRHPIYAGAALVSFGISLLSGSAGGLYVVSPLLLAAMTAYVAGFEQPGLEARFGESHRQYQPLLSLPRRSDARASWLRRLVLAGTAVVPWLAIGGLTDQARCTQSCNGAVTSLGDRPGLPVILALVPVVLLAMRVLLAGSEERLRVAVVAAFAASFGGAYLYLILPGLGVDIRSGGWELAVVNMLVGVAALCWEQVWSVLRWCTEWVANSRQDFLFVDGRFRIISHAIYPGFAGAIGLAIGGAVMGSPMAALLMGVFVVLGAAVFAQLLWGSQALLRPFGYWGAVAGALSGSVLLHFVFDFGLATIALAVVMGAPFVQAVGRLRCLSQGCCHGVETDPSRGIRVWQRQSRVVVMSGLAGRPILPTQLYSILFNCLQGPLLFSLYLSRDADAAFIVGLYFMLTGIERFAEDAYRGEKQTRWAGALRENQWIAISAAAFGMVVSVLPSDPPSSPDWSWDPLLLVAALLGGLIGAFGMSMDFPKSKVRYSRLSG